MKLKPSSDDAPASDRSAGLLVVTVDRLPAWMLGPYGATWVATPSLDSLAARGIVFDRVITPSLAVHDALRDLSSGGSPHRQTALAAADAGGWRPVVVTDDAAAAEAVAAGGGGTADSVRLVEAVEKEAAENDDSQTTIARLVDAALEVIATGEHRLVWCHIGSLGVAWDAPERYRDRYVDPEDPPPPGGARVPGFAVDADTDPDLVVGARQAFAGQVTLLDSQLGRLFAAVGGGKAAQAGPWSVLVAGVRGLPLGLHGWVGVGGHALPYGELVHVPAILVDASGRMAAQRYGGLVVPADLAATLADLVMPAHMPAHTVPPASAVDAREPWRGVSLTSLLENWSAPIRDRVIVAGSDGAAVVTPAWHGVVDGRREGGAKGGDDFRLFGKPDDYFEQANVADRCHDAAERLGALARQALGGGAQEAWLAMLPPDG